METLRVRLVFNNLQCLNSLKLSARKDGEIFFLNAPNIDITVFLHESAANLGAGWFK